MFTPYWAWYRQRVWRVLTNRTLVNASYVKHVDRMSDFQHSLGQWLHSVNPRRCVIEPELITHLPHHVQGIRPQGPDDQGLQVRFPYRDSVQEIWCAQQVGMRDRDWLYLGNACWVFRQPEDATHFQLVWS